MKNRMMANLVIACMIGGITLYASNAHRKEKERKQRDTSQLFTAIAPDTITSIHIVSKGHDNIELKKIDKDNWQLIKPINAKADLTPIDRILDMLTSKSFSKYDKSDVSSLESLELQPAKRVVRLNSKRFVIGGHDPISNRLYAMHKNTIHLIEDEFSHFLLLGYPVFVNRLILPVNSYIEAIQTPQYHIVKGNESWQTDPALSPEKVQAIFRSWNNAFSERVSYLLVNDLKDQETIPVQIITSDSNTILNLEAVIKEDQFWLCRKDIGVKYHMPMKLKDELLPEFGEQQ
ncbi:MAG: hypothetical protein D6B28_00775 [Gammaproteobacteria bacterium]|nr:MAG: hypothetical protein D6B28_00775 [Gammaproteobacteria bacterium]